ncbi:MAG: amidohydrolase [Clostridia bacterium]|nr:amidohydrolase [Clostridia bacterium]
MNKHEIAINAIEAKSEELIGLAQKMWDEPETAYNEVKAAQWVAEVLKANGFEVEVGAYNLPTCVVGRWGKGHPIVGFLGELDALPGMSQKVCTDKDPVVVGGAGQGCGHNLLASACLGGAIGMKAELEAKGIDGTVVYYGCPAEEVLTGKSFMAREGAFKDLDFAMSWHGGNGNRLNCGTMTGLNSAIFHFKGRTAHAGGDPHNGRSALDAAEIMSVGANYLREHVTSDVRIHYIYKEAGTAPNIVPDKAAVWYYVRAFSREAIEDTYNRLVKVAEGAAHMTETELEIEFLGGCYPTLGNETISQVAVEQLEAIGPVQWTEEELKFAEELNTKSSQYAQVKASGALDNGPLATNIIGINHGYGYGSTDVGDVMHIVPTIFIGTDTYNLAAPGHSWQITACAGMSIGYKGMLLGAKALAATGMEVAENMEILEKAKAEFAEKMKGKTYNCPITPDLPIPQPQV